MVRVRRVSSGPAAARSAPSTPVPGAKARFAALTTASSASVSMRPMMTLVAALTKHSLEWIFPLVAYPLGAKALAEGGVWPNSKVMKTDAARMRAFEKRGLTPSEVALGAIAFGEAIAWDGVRIVQAPPLGFRAMVPLGRAIVFSKWRAARDFADASAGEQGWFVHELMHVWQAARGTPLALAKLGALGEKAYRYQPRPGAKLKHYNIERQAEIARHLYLARIGAPDAEAPPLAWLEEIWASR